MGKLEHFAIVFSTQPPVFFPGQTVHGVVNVTLNEGMKMRNLRVKFEGKAKVHWTEKRGSGDKRRTVHFNNQREYFNAKAVLWGNPEGSDADNPTMEAGTYTLPFQFTLPYHIAASFEANCGLTGYVRYSVKATIDKPWKFDHETKTAFTVASFLDLNKPDIMVPAEAQGDKYHCCCCCKSGPISGTVHIPGRRGFVPGERIPVEGEISNKANVKVKGWDVKLVKEVSYSAYHAGGLKTRVIPEVILSHTDNEDILPGEDKHISCQLEIPSLPPSELEHCDFIVINYYVILTLKPARSVNMDVKAHIIIGNIPLRSEWSRISAPAVMPIMAPPPMPLPPGEAGPPGSLPYGPPGTVPYPAAPYPPAPGPYAPAPGAFPPAQPGAFSSKEDYATNYGSTLSTPPSVPPMQPTAPTIVAPYPDMPPPSYNECFGAGAALKDEGDNDHCRAGEFKPLYPVFSWNQ